jgi:hypothetical protein
VHVANAQAAAEKEELNKEIELIKVGMDNK